MEEIKINEFDYEEFQGVNPFNCIIIASIMTGKTYFITQKLWPIISYRFPDLNEKIKENTPKSYKEKVINWWNGTKEKEPNLNTTVYIVTAEHNSAIYKKVIPHAQILTDFQYFSGLVNMIRDNQNKNIYGKDNKGENIYKNEVLVIIDDAASDEIINSEATIKLYTQMRHQKVSTIFCIQHPTKIVTPLMKNNTTIFIIGKLNDRDARSYTRNFVKTGLESLDSKLLKLSDKEMNSYADDYYNEKIMKTKYKMFVLTYTVEGIGFFII